MYEITNLYFHPAERKLTYTMYGKDMELLNVDQHFNQIFLFKTFPDFEFHYSYTGNIHQIADESWRTVPFAVLQRPGQNSALLVEGNDVNKMFLPRSN
ncbi:MAG TPA: hypothetical protein VNW99_05070 [Cytophagaceae bacterium]|jgi:hypothetical protein|nr:hypothetical protein [Cytophagaceae bacterium]